MTAPKRKPPKTTFKEMFDSLVRPEELAIAEVFGHKIEALAATDSPHFDWSDANRALVFVQHLRDGMTQPEASAAAFGITKGEALSGDLFADEPDDVMPEEPDSETGKDSSS